MGRWNWSPWVYLLLHWFYYILVLVFCTDVTFHISTMYSSIFQKTSAPPLPISFLGLEQLVGSSQLGVMDYGRCPHGFPQTTVVVTWPKKPKVWVMWVWYCWWKKSIHRVLHIPGGWEWDFFHPQYLETVHVASSQLTAPPYFTSNHRRWEPHLRLLSAAYPACQWTARSHIWKRIA